MTTHAPPIDLRSDTVTRPSRGMREAMARAEVGDDQFGEDPTINLLQEQAAHVLGKEAVLWIPTGTMANQIALRVLTRPGDEVIVSRESHAAWHETGGGGANAGIQFSEVGGRGGFTADGPRAHGATRRRLAPFGRPRSRRANTLRPRAHHRSRPGQFRGLGL